MNVLTTDKIIALGRQVNPDTELHSTSIAYIQTLIRPYAEVIEPASIEEIIQWIPLAFPGELSKHALHEILKIKTANAITLETLETDPVVETAAKDSIIEY